MYTDGTMNIVDALLQSQLNAARNKVIIIIENRFPIGKSRLTDIICWCHDNILDDVWDWEYGITSLNQFNFYFDNGNDATLFALRWSV